MPRLLTPPLSRAAMIATVAAGVSACDFSARVLPALNEVEDFEVSYRVLTVSDVPDFTTSMQDNAVFDSVLATGTCAFKPSFATRTSTGGTAVPPDFNYQGAGTDGLSVSVTTAPSTIDTATGNPAGCPQIGTVNFQMGGPGQDLGSGRRTDRTSATITLADGTVFGVPQLFDGRLTYWNPSEERLVGEVRFVSREAGTRRVALGRASFTITRD